MPRSRWPSIGTLSLWILGMHTTVIMNAKGGVGKTTITTNLASYFAANNVPTAVMDYDAQGSSLRWLKQRPPESAPIHAADASPKKGSALKSISRFIPRETEQLILDAPAAPNRLLMQELLDRSQAILIPVAPSKIDIHATANFIKELLLITCVRHSGIRVAVVANRARTSTTVYEPLERFVNSLKLTFLTRLLDSEVYIEAGDTGLGIFEMDEALTIRQRREFMPIVEWVDPGICARTECSTNVVPFTQVRA
jgi:chromosome partitioning protein